jgi:hypothetical protein
LRVVAPAGCDLDTIVVSWPQAGPQLAVFDHHVWPDVATGKASVVAKQIL